MLGAMPPRPADYESVIAVNAGRAAFDVELEAGGNGCAHALNGNLGGASNEIAVRFAAGAVDGTEPFHTGGTGRWRGWLARWTRRRGQCARSCG
jgi:hypothetical protein